MVFTELTINEFEQFSQSFHPTSFLQSEAMALVQQEQHRKVVCYGIKDGTTIIAAGLFVLRKVLLNYYIANCHQGPLMDYHQQEVVSLFIKGLKAELKKLNCFKLVITPNFFVHPRNDQGEIISLENNLSVIEYLGKLGLKHQGFENDLINGVGRWFFIKDLTSIHNQEDLLASYDQNTRNAIRKAQKLDVEVVEVEPSRYSEFKQLMEHTAQRRGFIDRKESYYALLMKHFKKDNKIKAYFAQINPKKAIEKLQQQRLIEENNLSDTQAHLEKFPNSKKFINKKQAIIEMIESIDKRIETTTELSKDGDVVVLAGAIFIHHGNEVTYLFSGAYEKYFGYNAPYPIQMVAQQWALENNCTSYNFYGTQGKYAEANDLGVYNFKKGFGGYVLEQPGNFELEVMPLINKVYQAIHKLRT